MLHIRVLSPPDVTPRLLDRLADFPGVQNLVVLEGAGRRPDGDAVVLDVDHRAANPVFRALRGLGLDRDGAITVEQTDASLTRTARPGGRIGSSAGSWHEAGGPALQLLLNVVLLIAVGAGGLSAQRSLWRRLEARQRTL